MHSEIENIDDHVIWHLCLVEAGQRAAKLVQPEQSGISEEAVHNSAHDTIKLIK